LQVYNSEAREKRSADESTLTTDCLTVVHAALVAIRCWLAAVKEPDGHLHFEWLAV